MSDKNLISASQLAVALGFEYQVIPKLRAQGMPGYPSAGRKRPHYRYSLDEVKTWLKNRNREGVKP